MGFVYRCKLKCASLTVRGVRLPKGFEITVAEDHPNFAIYADKTFFDVTPVQVPDKDPVAIAKENREAAAEAKGDGGGTASGLDPELELPPLEDILDRQVVDRLAGIGVTTIAHVMEVSDESLLAVSGIADATVAKIRSACGNAIAEAKGDGDDGDGE